MKISLLILGFSFSINLAYSQSDIIPDSLLFETCNSIINSKKEDDSLKIFESFDLHLLPVFSKLNDTQLEEAFKYAHVRLQKFCPEYKKLLDKKNPPKDDWIPLETTPHSKLNKESCRAFLTHSSYYYFDDRRDTVKLSLSNNYWVDHFKDGTYSKLSLTWVNECEFEIFFIESTNSIRKNLSKPGEKYKYRVIEKYPNYYLVCLDMKELKILGTFRIYYD